MQRARAAAFELRRELSFRSKECGQERVARSARHAICRGPEGETGGPENDLGLWGDERRADEANGRENYLRAMPPADDLVAGAEAVHDENPGMQTAPVTISQDRPPRVRAPSSSHF